MPKSKSRCERVLNLFSRLPQHARRGRDAEGKNKKALRRSHFSLFFYQVICPSGSRREFLSSSSAKNKSLRDLLKSDL